MLATLSNASPAASSIVPPRDVEIEAPSAAIQARVPAADDQADAGKDVAARAPAGRRRVRVQVVDRRPAACQRQAQRLGGGQADQQRAGQARRGWRRQPRRGRPAQRRPCASASSMTGRMRSTWAREAISGTTPPKRWCSSVLRGDDRREHLQLVGDHGGGRFVAGGFDRENPWNRATASARCRDILCRKRRYDLACGWRFGRLPAADRRLLALVLPPWQLLGVVARRRGGIVAARSRLRACGGCRAARRASDRPPHASSVQLHLEALVGPHAPFVVILRASNRWMFLPLGRR